MRWRKSLVPKIASSFVVVWLRSFVRTKPNTDCTRAKTSMAMPSTVSVESPSLLMTLSTMTCVKSGSKMPIACKKNEASMISPKSPL